MGNDTPMHHIQKSIILSLARSAPLRFTEMQPPRIANNTFSYHLKKLVSAGYAELTPQGYVPTRKALKLITYLPNTSKAVAPQSITILHIQNDDGEVLLLSRNRQPFQGWYGLPGGLIHRGETLDEAARRELAEKTTITTQEKLRAVGVLDFRYLEQQTHDVFLHAIAFIYAYNVPGDGKEFKDKTTSYGQLSWSRLGRDNILPEVFCVDKLVKGEDKVPLSVNFVEPATLPTLIDELKLHSSDGARAWAPTGPE